MKANNEATPSEVRVSLYESLADSAKHIGNHLDSSQITVLESVVSGSTDAAVRDAAAERLELSEHTVRSHIKHALRILRARLGLMGYAALLLKIFFK